MTRDEARRIAENVLARIRSSTDDGGNVRVPASVLTAAIVLSLNSGPAAPPASMECSQCGNMATPSGDGVCASCFNAPRAIAMSTLAAMFPPAPLLFVFAGRHDFALSVSQDPASGKVFHGMSLPLYHELECWLFERHGATLSSRVQVEFVDQAHKAIKVSPSGHEFDPPGAQYKRPSTKVDPVTIQKPRKE